MYYRPLPYPGCAAAPRLCVRFRPNYRTVLLLPYYSTRCLPSLLSQRLGQVGLCQIPRPKVAPRPMPPPHAASRAAMAVDDHLGAPTVGGGCSRVAADVACRPDSEQITLPQGRSSEIPGRSRLDGGGGRPERDQKVSQRARVRARALLPPGAGGGNISDPQPGGEPRAAGAGERSSPAGSRGSWRGCSGEGRGELGKYQRGRGPRNERWSASSRRVSSLLLFSGIGCAAVWWAGPRLSDPGWCRA